METVRKENIKNFKAIRKAMESEGETQEALSKVYSELEQMAIISSIGKRAIEMFKPMGYERDLISWVMDIEAAHADMPLDLEALLGADNGNFGHDLSGIAHHLNRKTGKLEDCFVPRYTI